MDFYLSCTRDVIKAGKRVVVIKAGNVGYDVATEARRLGAKDVTLMDIQEPASFGKERQAAEDSGAGVLCPVFIHQEYHQERDYSHRWQVIAGRYGYRIHKGSAEPELSAGKH